MDRESITKILSQADIVINGSRPWDIRVHQEGLYERLLAQGPLAAGESYMEGWWDCPAIDQMMDRALRSHLDEKFHSWRFALDLVKARVLNLQKKSRVFNNAGRHYDIGNDLYEAMLDRRMIYSCGYWKDAGDLERAQEAKMELICRKVGLRPGMRVLDIGCGWGGFVKFAAERYEVTAVGITVAQNQAERAKELCRGLPVEIRLQDYRDLEGSFDRAISVGMFEHVGYKNYPKFMRVVRRCLKPDGVFLLHTIGSNASQTHLDPWMQKYIFPGAMLPSIKQIGQAIEGLFVMEDWHNFGPDYDKTLMAWFQNFDQSWPKLRTKYGNTFYRMWKYYLLSCAGTFRARVNQVWQILFSPQGMATERIR